MNTRLLGLAVATLAFAGSSVYLAAQLAEERERHAEAAELTRRLNARIGDLEKAIAARVAPVPAPAGVVAGAVGRREPVLAPQEPGQQDVETPFVVPGHGASPAFARMMQTQMRSRNRRLYADVGERLRISKELAGRLIDLISEHQAEVFGQSPAFTSEEDARRQFEQWERDHQNEIADLIGADKAMALQEYQKSLPARQEFEMLANQLEGNDAPLTSEQRKKLLAVFIEERERVPQPEYAGGADPADMQRQGNAWLDDYEGRLADAARGILDERQLTTWNDIRQVQREMRAHIVVAPGMRGFSSSGSVSFISATPSTAVAERAEPARP
jgi:hypothetical protein